MFHKNKTEYFDLENIFLLAIEVYKVILLITLYLIYHTYFTFFPENISDIEILMFKEFM